MFDFSLSSNDEHKRESYRDFTKEIDTKFLGNAKIPYYEHMIANMLDNFKTLGCLMSLKVFLQNHLGDEIEKQGVCYYQLITKDE